MSNSGFTIIDNNILRDNDLNIYEKYFLVALKSFDHRGIGEVYPTYETLMSLIGTTKRNTVANLIRSLRDKNYIIVMKKNRVNCYKFIKDYLVVNTNADKRINSNNLKDTTTSNQRDTSNRNLRDTSVDNNASNSNPEDTTTSNQRDTSNSNLRDTSVDKNVSNSNPEDTTTSNLKDTSNSIQGDTLKIKDKNTKEKYINIFNTWNDIDIYNEDKLTMQIANSITIALRKHTKEEIITAIKNYKEIYYSDFYYDYTWSLQTFLTRQNALKKFTEDGDVWTSYKATKNKPQKEKFNLSDLID
ncbi:helix-turn-helix domain-containing protein [Clostridium sp. NSJ-6]|uniref:Helix-turn-helix domain-containing protein n=1 Tax=Clostridium hominis TaxID=2763036 RepID=A0ABR7DBG2_9CLOT|nr:helix-turn-helix domain-containing protein [Clostridium hominis]MBC5628729.1 helix-turn-helix domain-containing protein [Clostridium hominis]